MSNNAKNQMAMTGLYRVLKQLAEETDRDATLLQLLMFMRVAMAGDAGFDPSTLESELKTSSATITRTSQKLSAIGSDRKPGYDLARIDFNPENRSRRLLMLTTKGEKAVSKVAATLGRLS
jgi:DNA-binding MarR family transcriptional regulator